MAKSLELWPRGEKNERNTHLYRPRRDEADEEILDLWPRKEKRQSTPRRYLVLEDERPRRKHDTNDDGWGTAQRYIPSQNMADAIERKLRRRSHEYVRVPRDQWEYYGVPKRGASPEMWAGRTSAQVEADNKILAARLGLGPPPQPKKKDGDQIWAMHPNGRAELTSWGAVKHRKGKWVPRDEAPNHPYYKLAY